MDILKNILDMQKSLNVNDYEFVNLVNGRIRELIHGAKPLIENKDSNYFIIALSEILSGKIKPQIFGKPR